MEEKERIEQEIRNLIADLTSPASPIGDWKNIKQLDENCYSESEMAEYRAERARVRAKINELQELLEQLDE